jgi:hypothetical protein
MNDYDFYLRHGAVRGGEWVGFPLAWEGLGGIAGFARRPHLRWRPWLPDPTNPNDPALGSWGVWQWRFYVAAVDGLVGLQRTPPADGRTAADMHTDMLAYQPLSVVELKDVDDAIYLVRMTGYQEQAVEPHDLAHPNVGRLLMVEFAEVAGGQEQEQEQGQEVGASHEI